MQQVVQYVCLSSPRTFCRENHTYFAPSAPHLSAVQQTFVNNEDATHEDSLCIDDVLIERCSETVVGCFHFMVDSTLTTRLHAHARTHTCTHSHVGTHAHTHSTLWFAS